MSARSNLIMAAMLLRWSSVCPCQAIQYLREATINKSSQSVTITSNDPRPLLQTIIRLRKEYGWPIDYEDPIYGSNETRVLGGRAWIAGHNFTALIPVSESATPSERKASLDSLLAQYGRSGNPGKFTRSQQLHSRTEIVGINADGSQPLLDTIVSLPAVERTVDETVEAICKLVSEQRGIVIEPSGLIDNDMANKRVTIGSEWVSARVLLATTLAYMDIARVWMMNYDPNARSYHIGIVPLVRVQTDLSGRRIITQVRTATLD